MTGFRDAFAAAAPPLWPEWTAKMVRTAAATGWVTLIGVGLLTSDVHAQTKPRRSFWKSGPDAAKASPPQTSQTMPPPAKETPASPPAEEKPRDANPYQGNETVKLFYMGATWDVVIRDVAEATNSRLVGNRVPTGRFTRRDRKAYTRGEAVRIINKEIEQKGFRLVEQDELLILMDLPNLRQRYQPPEIKTTLERRAEQQKTAQSSPQDETTTSAPARPKRDPSVRPASHETTQDSAAEHAASAETDPRTVVVFRSRHRPVMEISKQVYWAYPERTELLSASRDGLPAFRVRQASGQPEKTVQLDITINAANEELRIDARKSQSDAMLKLLRSLDTPAKKNTVQRLMAAPPAVCQISAQLAPELERLRRKQAVRRPVAKAARQVEEQDEWLAQADDEPPEEQKPRTKSAETKSTEADAKEKDPKVRRLLPSDLSDVIGNLKGEVIIESNEDLGALILRGAEADVERVMEVIRQLELLSEAMAPQVHLLELEHVDSRALAELLTSVYERLTKFPGRATQPRENVAILSVSKPNAVLIIAPAADLESILELADQLDQPVDPLTEFQVFPLKTAVASQVEELLTDFYEEREGLGTRILIRADARSNSVIIRARPRDLDEAAALIKKMDRDSTASVSQIQIFPLKNAAAAELAAILNQAIQSVLAPPSTTTSNPLGGGPGGGGGGGAGAQIDEKFRDVKSTVLQFLAVDAEGERQLRSGMLSDIRITPDARVNALMVAAPERSMKLIAELIKQLDRPSAAVAEIKVFPLTNADAQRVVQQLQSLFSPGGQQGGGFNNQQRQALGIQVVGAEDAGSGLIPLRFSVDSRTNSIIAIGGAEALGVVEAILYRLDEGDIRERQQIVYRLKNSPAVAIANAVTQFLTSQRDLSRQDPNLVSSVEQLEREVIVVAEPVSNSLLISATPRYFNEIQRLVKKLDEQPAQVVIQALLVEVTLDNTDEFGIEFGFQNNVLFNRSVKDPPVTITNTTTAPNGTQTTTQQIIAQTATPGFNFANPAFPLGNNIAASPSAMGLQSLSNFSLSRVNGDLGFGGLVLSAGSDTVNMLLRALSYSRRLQVLSRPLIRTMDNQTATILQGQVVPVVNGVTISGNGLANPIVQQQEAGIILTVTPRISPDGQIVMDLVAEKSAYRAGGVPIFTDASNGNVIESPIKDISTARAVISVPGNQTVVIGGLITSSDDRQTRKVPIIGDMPILGYLFRYDNITTSRKELLIFLTPRLVREDSDSEMIKEVEMARMHFIESEAEEIHGPLRGVPAEVPIMDGEAPWIAPGQIEHTIVPLPNQQPTFQPSKPQKPLPVPPAPLDVDGNTPAPPEADLGNQQSLDQLLDVLPPLPQSRRKPPRTEPPIQQTSHDPELSETPAETSTPSAPPKRFLKLRPRSRS